MRSQFDDNGPGPDVGAVVSELTQSFRRNARKFGPALFVVLLVLLSGLGAFKVDPGEIGVVRRFGREDRKVEPGLHYRIPLIEKKDVINVEQIRRIEIGARGSDKAVDTLMLTGDENIVEVHMIVQYRIVEPSKYLFRLKDPEETLITTAEVALRSVVGRTKIDDVFTTGREQVQAQARVWLQKLVDDYESGLEITEVKLLAVDPPDQVKDAFDAVTRAREEKERLINEAKGYSADKVPRARGEAQKMQREAEAYKEQRVLRANGDAAKFLAVLAEYEKAESVTRKRLHLETVERILGRSKNKVFVDKDIAKGSLPVLQIGAKTVAAVGGQRP